MTHSPIVAFRRRMTFKQLSHGRLMPVLLSALALATAGPAWAINATTTTLFTTPAAPVSGDVINMKAVVTSGGGTVLGGTVTFSDTYNGVTEVLGSAQVQNNNGTPGTATLLTEVGGVGSHQFAATYAGTATFGSSTSTAPAVTFAGPYSSATALAVTGAAGNYTLTGTVSAFGPVIPTGTVTFTDTTSNVTLGTGTLSTTPSPQFTANTLYPIANMNNGNTGGTNGPAIGDFNGDGRLDYAVPTNGGTNGGGPIVILLGAGNGTFTTGTPITTTAPFEPTSVVVGDFNGDGNQDLAVLSGAGTGSVNIYLGNGNGTFQAALNFPVATTTSASRLLAVGDFNRDGFQDLVATNAVLNQVAILLGNGDGTFKPPVTYPVGVGPWNVVVGDINQDGFLDLAVASDGTGSASILQGNGDGTFKPFIAVPTGASQVGSVALGDFNGDGYPDLATTSAPDDNVYVLLNSGTATPSFAAPVTYPMAGGPYYLTIGDFNRDGHLDIISANNANPNVGVLLNSATTPGTFGTPTFYPVSGGAIFANAADINGDDRVDLTAVSSDGLNVLLSGESETASISNVAVNGCTTQSVTATYGGDTNYGTSTSSASSLSPNNQATTLSLVINPPNGAVGAQVMLQATLTPYNFGSTTTNGETISFFNNGVNIGTATLNNGVAVLNYTLINHAYSIQATYGGDCTFVGSKSGFVTGTPQLGSTINWPTPAAIVYGTALSGTQLDATATLNGHAFPGSFTYSPAAGTVLPAGTNTLTTIFTPSTPGYGQETASVQIKVNPEPTVIIWATPTPITYGTPLSDLQLDAIASTGVVPVSLTSSYNVYGITSPNSVYTNPPDSANQAGGFDNDGYTYSSSTLKGTVVWNGLTFNIGPRNNLDAVANTTIPLPAGQFSDLFMLGAMVNNIGASQTFIVTYTDGTQTTFTQNMSDWYNAKGWPGESVVSCSEDRNFQNGSTQADSACVYGYDIPLITTKTVQSVQLPGTRNIVMLAMDLLTPSIPGTFVYTPDAGTLEPVGTDTLNVTFTPTDTTDYTPATASVKLVVTQPVSSIYTTTIDWPTPAPIYYGTALSATQLDAVAVATARPTPEVPTSGSVIAMTTNGTQYNQTGFSNGGTYSYNSLNNGKVNYAGATFTLGTPNVPDAITNGAIYTLPAAGSYSSVYLIGAATTDGETSQPFTLNYADSNGSVTETLNISAWNNPAGYADETVVQTTNRQNLQNGSFFGGTYDLYGYQIPADPTRTLVSVTLPATPNVVILALGFGTNTQVTVPGTYTYNPVAGTTTEPVGTDTLSVSFTPNDPTSFTSATGTTQLTVLQAQPVINWPTPAAIAVNQKLTQSPTPGAQLDATATLNGVTVPGTFVYTPAAGSSFATPGVYTLSTTFTPSNTTDYATITATVQIVVGNAGYTAVSGAVAYPNCCFFSQPTPYIITVTGNNPAPTGTVAVIFGTTTLATGTLGNPSGGTSSATLEVPSGSFHPGNNAVTLSYSGGGGYQPQSVPATIVLRNPAIAVNPAGVFQSVTTTIPYVFAQAGSITYNYNPSSAPATEFSDSGKGTCQSGVQEAAGFACNFSVAFDPQLPGVRKGGIQVNFTPTGTSLTEPTLDLFLSGMSDSAQIALSSALQTTLNAALNQPQSLTFNPTDYANSNLYVTNSNAGQLDLLPSTGGGLTQWNASNTNLVYPSDLSFDAFDNLIVSDANAALVYSYAPSTTTPAQQTVGTAPFELGVPTQARFDLGGNLYIADAGNEPRIIQVPGEAYAPNQLNLGSQSVTFPQALAVDNLGANLYVGDGDTNQVLQIGLNGAGGTTTVTQFPINPCDSTVTSCAFVRPGGFAFDLNGDMYVVDGYPRVLKIPSTHVASGTDTTQLPITGLLNPTSITLDGAGNIYVADVTGFVTKLSVNTGALAFTTLGSQLQTTVTNTGDIPLVISAVTLGNGSNSSFQESDNCTGTSVAPGGTCTITVTYATSNGADTLTLTSNAFSPTGVTIQLSY
jgi:hypothetical protein